MNEQQQCICGLVPALAVIGGKWKALILWEMNDGPVRFGELKRRVQGISEKMLIQALRELEADGVVHREAFHQVPPKVEYSATEFGASLNAVLEPLCRWGEQHMERIAAFQRE
ncbi:MAG: transcriptional regulator [Gemmatimonas sp.]|nr:transcriptional regulator [Gemmatimonas sp.]